MMNLFIKCPARCKNIKLNNGLRIRRESKWEERRIKYENELRELEQQKKTHLKRYQNLRNDLEKHLRNKPASPTIKNYPDHFVEFELTNRNHIGYLIYDHLGIKDVTRQFDPEKRDQLVRKF